MNAFRTTDARQPLAAPGQPRSTQPVKFWAVIGCLMWAFQTFVLVKWLTGPFFERVPTGPVEPPTSMKIAMVTFLCIEWALFVAIGYRWVDR